MSMCILHVVGGLGPAGGGPPGVAVRLACAQALAGHNVTLLTNQDAFGPDVLQTYYAAVPGLKQLRVRMQLPPVGLAALLRDHPDVREAVKSARVMHLHGIWDAILPVAAMAARSLGIPYVVRPAGMLDPWSLAQNAWKKRLAMRVVYRRMLTGAAFLHMLNVDEANLLEPLHLGRPKRIIPNGIFLEEIEPRPASGSFRSAHPALGDRPYVLFVSRLHHKKGLDYLADAFARVAAQVREAQLVVAGPDEGEEAAFRTRVARLGVAGRVHLVGPLYGRDKVAAMSEAAVFCLPSRQEGFSVAVLEALACGAPAVISTACHFPEVAEVGAGEIVPLEVPAIAAALVGILGRADARQTIGARGRRLIEDKYTWQRVAAQCDAAYKSIAAPAAG